MGTRRGDEQTVGWLHFYFQVNFSFELVFEHLHIENRFDIAASSRRRQAESCRCCWQAPTQELWLVSHNVPATEQHNWGDPSFRSRLMLERFIQPSSPQWNSPSFFFFMYARDKSSLSSGWLETLCPPPMKQQLSFRATYAAMTRSNFALTSSSVNVRRQFGLKQEVATKCAVLPVKLQTR